MATSNRPLSPHLQIYRPQLTSVLSLLHRATGLILALGAVLVAWWFWSIMLGGDSYETAYGFFTSWFGWILLFLWTLCTFYHLCNGIRHLLWDAGLGLELDQAYLSGKIVIGATVVLTILALLL